MKVNRHLIQTINFVFILSLFCFCTKEETVYPPELTTTPVTNITPESATGGGFISSDGGAGISERGVCWSTKADPTTADSIVSAKTGRGQFVAIITGLKPATTYHIRAYATNAVATTYGADLTFTTTGQVPAGLTHPATGISETKATLNGAVNPNSLQTTVSFEYGTTTSYGLSANAATSPVTGSSLVNVNTEITGLTPGTIYHFRVKTVNTLGTVYGGDLTFTTAGQSPEAVTIPATNITYNTATLNGAVDPNFISTVVSFEYGQTTSYGQTVTATQSPVTGISISNVSASIAGLLPGITYHFRVKTTNALGTVYGGDMIFMTPNLMLITTTLISSITSTSASSGGNVISDGGAPVESKGVCWNTAGNPTIQDTKTLNGQSTGIFTSSLTGLLPNTLYYVRAYASSSVGTSYGNQVTFTTLPQIPTNGLVAYYPFNGNAFDESGNGNNGTISGPVLTIDRFGKTNKSYYFGSLNTDVIKVAHSSTINFNAVTDSYTINTWFKADINKMTSGFSSVLIAKDGTPGYPYKSYFSFRNDSILQNAAVHDFSSSLGSALVFGYPKNDSWHMMTFVVDNPNDKIIIYLDAAKLSETKNNTEISGSNTWEITIGNGWAGHGAFLGSIDDIRLYNRTLNLAEIQSLFHEGGW